MNNTNNIDFTDALSSMTIPNNQSTSQPKKKSSKPKTNKTNTQKSNTKQKTNKTNKKTNNNINNNTKLQSNKNPNGLTPKQKTKQQSQKDFKKVQLENNNNNRISLFKNVLDNINKEKQENNLPIMTLQRFTTITNSLMKIFNDMNYLIQDTDTIYDLLTDKMDKITDTIKDKSINTQRKIITDIITILNSNPNTQLKDIRKYEYYRKKLYLTDKVKNDMNDNDNDNSNQN
jgi:hypothetical protein